MPSTAQQDNAIKGKVMNQVKQTVVALGVLALLAGCTGDDSTVSSSSSGYEVSSGLAQKGPLLRGSSVTVNELNTSTLQPSGKSYTFEVLDDLGTFKPSNITFSSAYLENTALGYYFNELTGQKSSDMVYLRGLSYLGTDKAVNLNVLSTFVKNRIKKLVTTAPVKTFVVARPQAERELLGAFYIYNAVDLLPGTTVSGVTQPANFMELDLSKKRAGDQILAAISGMVAQIGQTGSGVNYFLNQVETDLADDGLINNSPNFPVSVQQQLSAAAKSTDFGAVAANLNAFYKTNYSATDLSQWVDTSGGVDKVIDKYKFSASNVPVGTESKSPEYVAGSEDAGQCFSVSAGKLYRNGAAVATGTVKAVKGDKFVIGLTGSVGGTTYSGFVQRSAPDAKGVCPQVVPNSGLTRLQKYTVQIILDIKLLNQPHYVRLLNNGSFVISGNILDSNQDISGSYVNIYGSNNSVIKNITSNNARSTGGGYTDSIDVTKDNFTYFGSWGELYKLDLSGNIVWKKTVPGADYGYLSVSPDGGVFAAGANNNGQFWGVTNANTITKYDLSGNISWSTQLPMKVTLGVSFLGVAATPDGGVIATGVGNFTADTAYQARTSFIAKLNSVGEVVWQKNVVGYANPAITDNMGISNPAIDGSGNIIVGIWGTPSVGGFSDGNYVTKIDKDGNVIWTKAIAVILWGVRVSPDGTIIGLTDVGGGIGREPGTIKKYTADGIYVKDIIFNATDFIIIDPSSILVTGYDSQGAFAKSVSIN